MPSERDLDTLAWTMLGEAGGEGEGGMADVGHVILNRLETGRYGASIADVARANKQFSTWNAGEGGNNPQGRYPKNSAEFKKARALAEQVVAGAIPGPPGKPLDYHTPNISPYWADSKDKFGTYERNGHLFYASVPVPPGEIPNAVGTTLSTTRPPVTGSPTPLPPMLAAQRSLQPTTQDTSSLYRGIFPQQAPSAPLPRSQPSMVFGSGINDSFAAANAASSPNLAAQLANYVAPKPATRPAPRQPSPSERTALAYVAPPRVPPAANGRNLQRAEQTQRNQPRVTTVASIPTTPARVQLPALPPSRTASPRMVQTSMQRAAAAQDPRLAAALAAPRPPAAAPRQPSASERSALAYVAPPRAPAAMKQPNAQERAALAYVPPPAPPVNPRIGQPPVTRSVASVPVRPPAVPRQPNAAERAALAYVPPRPPPIVAPTIPGPNMAPKIGEERLVAGVYPMAPMPGLPKLPGQDLGVGTALSVVRPVLGFPPIPRPRPMQPGKPTPLAQRPVQQLAARPLFAMPTAIAQRPVAPPPRAPLNVTVYANTAKPKQTLNPSNHSAAQLAALKSGKSTFSRSPGAVSEPVRAMNGKIRNTY